MGWRRKFVSQNLDCLNINDIEKNMHVISSISRGSWKINW